MSVDVIVVGGGIAGLCCARQLRERGLSFVLLEADSHVGGRMRTDEVDGFQLDRGFQVLLTAYPEARRTLDYERLDLRPFSPGALVRYRGRFHRVADPWRQPRWALATLLAPIGTWRDKLRMARLRRSLLEASNEPGRVEKTTRAALSEAGFSNAMINRFFRPFFGGVFLDRELETDHRLFAFLFEMFARGDTAVPAAGMQAIPRQLAEALPSDALRCNTRVDAITAGSVRLASGETLDARGIVVATDGPSARQLAPDLAPVGSRAVHCLYFAADASPLDEPVLCLDADGDGPINNLVVMSDVSGSYAPAGRALVSVSVLEGEELDTTHLEGATRRQLTTWFGDDVRRWDLLRHYFIRHALPAPGWAGSGGRLHATSDVWFCGDYCVSASIQGAMQSGRETADAVADQLQSAA